MITRDSESKVRNRAGLRWALVPFALLGSSLIGVGSMAFVAAHDPNFATEADYYQKAVRWDHVQAQARDNQRLSYQIALPATVPLDAHGQAALEVTLKDRNGRAIVGARVSAEAFANAYSGAVLGLEFSERAPGVYTAHLAAGHAGLWEFRFAALCEGDRFTAIVRSDLVPGGAA